MIGDFRPAQNGDSRPALTVCCKSEERFEPTQFLCERNESDQFGQTISGGVADNGLTNDNAAELERTGSAAFFLFIGMMIRIG